MKTSQNDNVQETISRNKGIKKPKKRDQCHQQLHDIQIGKLHENDNQNMGATYDVHKVHEQGSQTMLAITEGRLLQEIKEETYQEDLQVVEECQFQMSTSSGEVMSYPVTAGAKPVNM